MSEKENTNNPENQTAEKSAKNGARPVAGDAEAAAMRPSIERVRVDKGEKKLLKRLGIFLLGFLALVALSLSLSFALSFFMGDDYHIAENAALIFLALIVAPIFVIRWVIPNVRLGISIVLSWFSISGKILRLMPVKMWLGMYLLLNFVVFALRMASEKDSNPIETAASAAQFSGFVGLAAIALICIVIPLSCILVSGIAQGIWGFIKNCWSVISLVFECLWKIARVIALGKKHSDEGAAMEKSKVLAVFIIVVGMLASLIGWGAGKLNSSSNVSGTLIPYQKDVGKEEGRPGKGWRWRWR